MANIPRLLSLAVFRVHIENGLSVALGVGLVGLTVGGVFGFNAAVAAGTGAMCISFSDQPDPINQKPWILGYALLAGIFFSALASFTRFVPGAFFFATAVTGLWAGLISVYGKRALFLSVTGVLGFVFAMGQHFANPGEALARLELFSLGAVLYAAFAGLFAWSFDDRVRRLLLAEAIRAFANYLRAKATLYNPDAEGPAAFRAMIDAHAVLTDRLQTARDSLFARRSHPLQLKRIDTLIALLDAFESILSSDADFELLRRSERRDLKWRMSRLVGLMADETEGFTLALRSRRADVFARQHETECRELIEAVAAENENAPESEAQDYAFTVTAAKLARADANIAALGRAIDRASAPSRLASELDLGAFRQTVPHGIGVLLRQFTLKAPAMRYAIRLSLAMCAGLALTYALPRFAHANWVLLTIALIVRANYSITRQRRWDRVTGTLIGCAIAVLFINTLPPVAMLAAIVLAIGVSHAYSGVKYRVTAIGASVSSLLVLHFAAPLAHPQFFERIIDTLIGAGMSYVFSFLLPSWERNTLPRLVKALIDADIAFAQAALRVAHSRQAYRLARKKTMDAVAQLSGAIRRLADEPNSNRRALASLNELLAANYLLASDFSSMPVLMQIRAAELDPELAQREIDAARARVVALLSPEGDAQEDIPAPPREGLSGLSGNYAVTVLARRLAHIENAARKVGRLAARPTIDEERRL